MPKAIICQGCGNPANKNQLQQCTVCIKKYGRARKYKKYYEHYEICSKCKKICYECGKYSSTDHYYILKYTSQHSKAYTSDSEGESPYWSKTDTCSLHRIIKKLSST